MGEDGEGAAFDMVLTSYLCRQEPISLFPLMPGSYEFEGLAQTSGVDFSGHLQLTLRENCSVQGSSSEDTTARSCEIRTGSWYSLHKCSIAYDMHYALQGNQTLKCRYELRESDASPNMLTGSWRNCEVDAEDERGACSFKLTHARHLAWSPSRGCYFPPKFRWIARNLLASARNYPSPAKATSAEKLASSTPNDKRSKVETKACLTPELVQIVLSYAHKDWFVSASVIEVSAKAQEGAGGSISTQVPQGPLYALRWGAQDSARLRRVHASFA